MVVGVFTGARLRTWRPVYPELFLCFGEPTLQRPDNFLGLFPT